MHRTTFVTDDSILTKLSAFGDEYTLFTTQSRLEDSKYQSIVKFSKYRKVLWSVRSKDAAEAVINHIALFNMACAFTVFDWKQHRFELCKPLSLLAMLYQKQVFAKEGTFNSAFTKKMFKAAGIKVTFTEVSDSMHRLVALLGASILLVLSISFNFSLD